MIYLSWSIPYLLSCLFLWGLFCISLDKMGCYTKLWEFKEGTNIRKTKLKSFLIGVAVILCIAIRVGDKEAQQYRVNFNSERPTSVQEVYRNNRPTSETIKKQYQETLKSKEEVYD